MLGLFLCPKTSNDGIGSDSGAVGLYSHHFSIHRWQILLLVTKYHDTHCKDKEVLVTIRKAIDASPELHSKKVLIENFIAGITDVSDVMIEWHDYVATEKEKQLAEIIAEENLNNEETRKFVANSFRDGEVRTTGTDIDRLMPHMSRFGGGDRAKKKTIVLEKLKAFFDRFFGIG